MLKRTEPAKVDDLQRRVDQLSDLLMPPKRLPTDAIVAQRAFVEATKDVNRARAALWDASRAHPSQRGYGPTPEVAAAQQSLQVEENRRERIRAAIALSRQRVDDVWLAAVVPQLQEASLVLLDLASLAHEAVSPVVDLAAYAFRHGLAMPRLLASANALQMAVVHFTALLNQATASTAAASIDEDSE